MHSKAVSILSVLLVIGGLGSISSMAQNLPHPNNGDLTTIPPKKSILDQKKIPTDDAYEFIAIVNGEPISKGLYEISLQEWLSQGQKDSEQLRKNLKEELINRELIAQEVVKQGLNRNIDMRDHIKQLEHRLYLQLYTEQFLKEKGLNEAALNDEYQNQKKSPQNIEIVQYKVGQIVTRKESSAIAVVGRLQQGESFEAVAAQLAAPLEAKAPQSFGVWVNANELPPQLSLALASLPIGGITNPPIAVDGGWLILKLVDKRKGKPMTYAEYKSRKIEGLLREYYNETLKRLHSEAKIN